MAPVQGIYKSFGQGKSIFYTWGEAMHTRVDLILCNGAQADLKSLAGLIFEEIGKIEKSGNKFDPDSEITFVNKNAPARSVMLSPALSGIITQCMEYHKKTLGYFDITVGSVGHHSGSMAEIRLNPENRCVFFKQPGLELDLSGFLKGYALDKIRDVLLQSEMKNALVNLGNSSVLALGDHPCGAGWKIGNNPDHAVGGEAVLSDQCFTTSGNHSEDRRHIIDPESGRYAEGHRTVSVISQSGAVGEVLSTALFVAPPEIHPEIIAGFPGVVISNKN